MAAAGKPKKSHSARRKLFNFGACFGFPSTRKRDKESSAPAGAAAAGVGGGLVKYGGRKYSSLGKTFPISHNTAFPSVKEIQVVRSAVAAETPPTLPHGADNKLPKDSLITEIKNRQGATTTAVQEFTRKPPPPVSPAAALPHQTAAGGTIDSLIGALMITLILVVMLLWGKTLAILFTASWFYSVHLLRQPEQPSDDGAAAKSMNDSDQNVDLDSKQYKKRVVLQGFLQRV